ncbi:MAG TPA: DUF2029 domain-containing protein [Propionibacterium sp.]|nr:DUF2029 domain-containing protein [Propionibacterium sp.]
MTPPAPTVDRRPRWGSDASAAATLVLTLAVVWGVAKLLAVWGWVVAPSEYGDTYYYFLTAEELARAGGGIDDALREYPTPAGLLLLLPWELGATDHEKYRAAVIGLTTAADALFTLLLGRRLGPVGVLAWVALTAALGPLVLLRFDLLPAVVAGAAVLLAMEGRRVAASVLVGLGTGLKVWPIVLFPLTLRRRQNLAPTLALAVTGVALVAASLLAGGWDRLLSPLSYQRDRGLQIEAVPATIPMREWAGDPDFRVWFSTFHAFEVTGPSVGPWLTFAQVASIVGAVLCLALLAWWFHHGADPQAIAWLALVLVGTFVVTSRALSPQYLLWLAAPAAVLVGLALRDGPDAPPAAPALFTFALVLSLCGLTTGVYPVYYDALLVRGRLTDRALFLLTLRNVGLLVLVAWAAACALVTSRGTPARGPRRPGWGSLTATPPGRGGTSLE